jgi:hypothetical protein
MMLLTLAAALAAPCDAPTSTVTLGAALDRAEVAFGELDTDGFRAAVDDARAAVPCLDETLPTPLAASLHRFEGLAAFLDGSPDRAQRAFAGARRLEPSYRFPRSVVPEGNPVLRDYEALDPDEVTTTALPTPAEGAVRLDGQLAAERVTSFPVVFQRTDGAGSVVQSAYLWPSMPTPDYAVAPATPEGRRKGADPAAIGLAVGAGVAGITSGVLYGMASSHRRAFESPDTPYADLAAEQRATNQLGTAGGAALLVAAGTGLGAFFVGVF